MTIVRLHGIAGKLETLNKRPSAGPGALSTTTCGQRAGGSCHPVPSSPASSARPGVGGHSPQSQGIQAESSSFIFRDTADAQLTALFWSKAALGLSFRLHEASGPLFGGQEPPGTLGRN